MLAMQGAPAAKGVKTLRNTPLPWEEEEASDPSDTFVSIDKA